MSVVLDGWAWGIVILVCSKMEGPRKPWWSCLPVCEIAVGCTSATLCFEAGKSTFEIGVALSYSIQAQYQANGSVCFLFQAYLPAGVCPRGARVSLASRCMTRK